MDEARAAANLIDCIWFKNARLMPAVIEIEYSTEVRSGLTKDEELCNLPQFISLRARYFPYSAVEEIHYLSQRRKIKGVTEEFLDCYMGAVFADFKVPLRIDTIKLNSRLGDLFSQIILGKTA